MEHNCEMANQFKEKEVWRKQKTDEQLFGWNDPSFVLISCLTHLKLKLAIRSVNILGSLQNLNEGLLKSAIEEYTDLFFTEADPDLTVLFLTEFEKYEIETPYILIFVVDGDSGVIQNWNSTGVHNQFFLNRTIMWDICQTEDIAPEAKSRLFFFSKNREELDFYEALFEPKKTINFRNGFIEAENSKSVKSRLSVRIIWRFAYAAKKLPPGIQSLIKPFGKRLLRLARGLNL